MAFAKTIRKSVAVCVGVGLTLVLGFQFSVADVNAQKSRFTEPEVLVGLARATSVSLDFSQTYEAFVDGKRIEIPAQGNVSVKVKNGKPVVTVSSGSAVSYEAETLSPVFITPCSQSDKDCFRIKECNLNHSLVGQEFRGSALITEDGGSLILTNLLELEKYLWSVVSCEVPAAWAKDALKAQAVASRTYAASRVGMKKGTPVVFARSVLQNGGVNAGDVRIWATEDNQVYRGKGCEDPRVVEACVETKGQVVVYQGQLVEAFFHSDAGGMTEDPRFVWGGAIPYLTGVAEVPHLSPYSAWEVCFDAKTVGRKLEGYGLNGSVDMIKGVEPGISGRWFAVNVGSGNKSVRIKGSEFRPLLKLKSLWFSVFRKGGNRNTLGFLNPGFDVYVDNGTETQTVCLKRCKISGPKRNSVATQGAAVVGAKETGSIGFVLQGRGHGHGVGLSQWGANAMADEGADFTGILMHYYPGTGIESWW